MAKMMRARKHFGRCNVQGHGQNCFCEVMEDIQGTHWERAEDKREVRKEIKEQLCDEVFYQLPTGNEG